MMTRNRMLEEAIEKVKLAQYLGKSVSLLKIIDLLLFIGYSFFFVTISITQNWTALF